MQSRLTKPPGPKGHRLLGSLMEIRRDRIRFVTEATRNYGDVVSFTMGPRRIYLLRHPDHIRHVLMENHENYVKGLGLKHAAELLGSGLLTSEGAQWSRQRQEITPSLSQEINQQRFAQRAASIVERRINRWYSSSSIDVAREMVLLGITIVGETMLGYSLEDHAEQIADDLNVVTTDAMKRMTAALPGPWNRIGRNAKSALKHLDELVFDPVRRFGNREQACFPEVLDHAQENEQELRDQVMTLLVAGHETTASTLSWALHLLALHPEIQERVHGEIEHVLEDRLPLPADLPKLPYIGMVLHETMRLYPAVWLLPRRSLNRDMIGGYEIPANSDVLLSVYSMHRHPEFWTAAQPAAAYAQLTQAAYPAIKQAAPQLTVLAGSMSFADRDFLEAFYAAGGLGSYDAIAVHPYNEGRAPEDPFVPEWRRVTFLPGMRWLRDGMLAAGDHSPVWITEMGWTGCKPASTHRFCVTDAQQAEYLERALQLIPTEMP